MRLLVLLLCAALLPAQELDTVVDKDKRKTADILDQLENPAERKLFLDIYRETRPMERRSMATQFLALYPSSWLLPQIYEALSKAAMDLGDSSAAVFYARQSLRLYPENPLLLVPLAIVQIRRGEKRQAADAARAALEDLGRFARPAAMPERTWVQLHDNLRASALQVLAAAGETAPPGRAPAPKRDASSAYAGSAACARCHTAEYKAWQQTGMARMLRPIEPGNVFGDFSEQNEFQETGAPVTARMTRNQKAFYFDIRRAAGGWDRYRIDFTIGSKWQQAYATRAVNGDLHVLPVQYNRLEKKWINYWRSIDPAGSERADIQSFHAFRRVTSYQQNCAQCHTSQATETSFAEPGINCEMCHGPSAAHVKGAGQSFSFRKIDNRAYVEVCAQCHAQSALRDPQGFPPRYERRPYVEFSRRAFYRDGRFRETTFIVESFERSACFRKGQAHCGSCHNPHPDSAASNPKSLKYPGDPDRMCLQCHPVSYADAEHTRHAANNEGSRCVSCHMPKIMNSLLFLARSHQIDDKPDADMTLRFGERESPNACLICHPRRTAQWTREQLQSW